MELPINQIKDKKHIWYNKGWDACVREFEWRLKFLFEKNEKYCQIAKDRLRQEVLF